MELYSPRVISTCLGLNVAAVLKLAEGYARSYSNTRRQASSAICSIYGGVTRAQGLLGLYIYIYIYIHLHLNHVLQVVPLTVAWFVACQIYNEFCCYGRDHCESTAFYTSVKAIVGTPALWQRDFALLRLLRSCMFPASESETPKPSG